MNNLCKCPFPYCNDIASLKFINIDKISYTCLRNHNTIKEFNEIKKDEKNKNNENKNNNKLCFCKEHNSELLYFCYLCQINFCHFCKDKHINHKYIFIKDKIPSNNIIEGLEKFFNLQKKEMEKINQLFNELIGYLRNQFDTMFNSLYNYFLYQEEILFFSINNINHINSIENIKYLMDVNFPRTYHKNKINNNLYKIEFNFEKIKEIINNKPIFTQIEYIYKYISDIFISSQKQNINDDISKNNDNENSIMVLYKKPFIENKKNLKNVNKKENKKIKEEIKKIKFELKQYKILNEHEEEIRNIISLNNGFFASSSLDCTFKIFNSLTGECILSMKEPYEDQICYLLEIKMEDSINNSDETNLLLLSRHLIFIRFDNNTYYNHNGIDENNQIEVMQSIDNNGIYISQGIQLSNSNIITYNDNNEIKIYKFNPKTKTYLLIYYNINFKGIEFCSLLEIKSNIFVASSNEKLEKGENIIKVFNTLDKDIFINDDKNIIIKNINCSTGRDSLTIIQKNKILAVGLQYFDNYNNNKNNVNHLVNGIGLIDINCYQVIQIIENYRVHSMCTINLYINYSMLNISDIFKSVNLYKKRKILVTAGYDKEQEIRIIKFFEIIKSDDDLENRYKFIEIINQNEIISEHEGFINSIKWLENGIVVTGSSDKMIFLYNYIK